MKQFSETHESDDKDSDSDDTARFRVDTGLNS